MAHLCGFVRVRDLNPICGLTPHRFILLSYPLRFLTNLIYEIFTTAALSGDLEAGDGFAPSASGIWARRATTALPRLVKENRSYNLRYITISKVIHGLSWYVSPPVANPVSALSTTVLFFEEGAGFEPAVLCVPSSSRPSFLCDCKVKHYFVICKLFCNIFAEQTLFTHNSLTISTFQLFCCKILLWHSLCQFCSTVNIDRNLKLS